VLGLVLRNWFPQRQLWRRRHTMQATARAAALKAKRWESALQIQACFRGHLVRQLRSWLPPPPAPMVLVPQPPAVPAAAHEHMMHFTPAAAVAAAEPPLDARAARTQRHHHAAAAAAARLQAAARATKVAAVWF
jgi:hypothetical protein